MTVGRLHPLHPAVPISPEIDAAVNAALAAAGFGTEPVTDVDFEAALDVAGVLITREGYLSNTHLLADVGRLTEENQRSMAAGAELGDAELAAARARAGAVRRQLAGWLRRFPVLALPTLPTAPPSIGQRGAGLTTLTAPINVAGLPALALPVPVREQSSCLASARRAERRRGTAHRGRPDRRGGGGREPAGLTRPFHSPPRPA